MALRAGAEVKISDLLHGQASGGYAERDYQDVRLPQLRGPTIDAALICTIAHAADNADAARRDDARRDDSAGASGEISRTITAELRRPAPQSRR